MHDGDHGAAAERLGALSLLERFEADPAAALRRLGLPEADVAPTLEALDAPRARAELHTAIEYLLAQIGNIDSTTPLPRLGEVTTELQASSSADVLSSRSAP